ncbi:beta-glucosidase-like glycosyl hydrolase [Sphaerochaeta pleomorpha str. Grapes]|uniref:Beta-glucosidase-like glycosyl hydrolase n=1 Tax=Sphaerochaeta pleomorpha (strain ATCC BAA-1885 / DSM 22778 / Grapes) TaxID=158190 RepID=G8QT72_SPHPG|nr:glycoside hydrolase family 3 N-terminal domain-containing protein [Sphaerochaeta pleomorpha]AEV29039.1 beta-glucosidase-like glycosyl hydrolase [Sphaerochaeta pleomorpha str. Grapes]
MHWFDRILQKLVQKKMIAMLSPRDIPTDTEPMSLVLKPGPSVPLPQRILAEMTEDEKLNLISGVDEFCIRGIPRLGVKPVWTSDATMALRGWKTNVTDFPATIAMAASFDRALLREVGKVLAQECKSLGIGVLLGPGVNIARLPTCGRNFEYCGEDPYLTGEVASSYIQGVQSQGVIATVKHFACNNSEYDRHKCNSVVDERTLREIYLPPFKKAVEAGVLGLMTSYNPVNGTYCSEHPYLLGEILRHEWGYDGMVISDWNSLYSTVGAACNGVDLEMPGPKWFDPKKLKKEIAAGKVSMADIDAKLLHIFTSYEKAGLFNRQPVVPGDNVGTAEHFALAKHLASESVVLLKNTGSLLPLQKKKGLVVCVGGRNAFQIPAGGGSSMVQLQQQPDNLADQMLKEGVEVVLLPARWWRKKAYREKVKNCDAIIFSTGFDHFYESESYDRRWQLPSGEADEMHRIASVNANLIVILHGGGDLETTSWITCAKSVLYAFYLGSSTAPALADILFGRCNPCGKLPFSMAKDFSNYRSVSNYPHDFDSVRIRRIQGGQGNPNKRFVWDMEYRENLMVGYRLFDTEGIEVAFPFGHGLSYSTFSYANLQLEKHQDGSVSLSFTITNTGKVDGKETVQVYIHEELPAVFRPRQELKQFEKVFLGAGASAEVKLFLPADAFCHYDSNAWKFVRGNGSFSLRIGSSSRDIRLQAIV